MGMFENPPRQSVTQPTIDSVSQCTYIIMTTHDDVVGGLLDLAKKKEANCMRHQKKIVPTIVPADSHSKPLQKLCHLSSWMMLHNFEPKKSTNGSVFVSVALVKVTPRHFLSCNSAVE